MNFKGQLFQLRDKFNDEIGLLYTADEKIKENTVEDLWIEYCKEFEPDADDFVEWINNKLNIDESPQGIYFERVFVADTNAE